ncbi:MAG: superoxide dismutase [Bacteriovorax sp.]
MNIVFPELPYPYNALEKCIDAQTMDIHYNKHHRKYFEKFQEAMKNVTGVDSLEHIFSSVSQYDPAIRNNGGGLYNHTFFWNSMTPNFRECNGALKVAIEKKYGTMDEFKKKFSETAMGVFGSGWVWLILDSSHQLQIVPTHNHDNPLMDVCEFRGQPLLTLDLWEHAYYLRYKSDRKSFIDNWWGVVNWKYAEDIFKWVNE